jgi:hypothetical protein
MRTGSDKDPDHTAWAVFALAIGVMAILLLIYLEGV